MAITFDNASAQTRFLVASSGTTSHTCNGTNRLLYVTAITSDGQTVSGITYNGVSMTLIGTGGLDGSNRRATTYYLVNPTSGANNIVTTLTGSSASLVVYSASYTNVDQFNPILTSSTTASFTGTTMSQSLTSAIGGYLILSGTWSAGTPTPLTNCTVRQNETAYIGSYQVDNTVGGVGSITVGFTAGSQNFTGVGVSLKPNNIAYATFNPSDSNANITLSNGNLTASPNSGSWGSVRTTISKTSGKWYWEYTLAGGIASVMSGIAKSSFVLSNPLGTTVTSDAWAYYINGAKYYNNTSPAYGASYTSGDIIGVALDMDAGTITFYKNNTSQGQAFTGITGAIFGALSVVTAGGSVTANFGATPMAYTAPSGYNQGLYNTLTDNLISYWKLDESSGNASDSVGTNILTNTNTVTYVSGLINNCADFGTANTNKKLTIASNLGITNGAISMSMWVKLNTEIATGTWGFAQKGNATNHVQYIIAYEYNAGTRRVVFNRQKQNVSNNTVTNTITMGTSNFYHLVLTYDGTTLEGYVNGTSAGTLSTTGDGTGAGINQFDIGEGWYFLRFYRC